MILSETIINNYKPSDCFDGFVQCPSAAEKAERWAEDASGIYLDTIFSWFKASACCVLKCNGSSELVNDILQKKESEEPNLVESILQ